MIKNPKFDEALQAVKELRLITPRLHDLPQYKCLDCSFYTREHFVGEDAVDCFTTQKPGDSPFTCLRHERSLYDSNGPACEDMKIKPLYAKLKEAEMRLADN